MSAGNSNVDTLNSVIFLGNIGNCVKYCYEIHERMIPRTNHSASSVIIIKYTYIDKSLYHSLCGNISTL